MSARDRLALEHLTAPSFSPLEIVDMAAAQGWAGATVLAAPFPAFPQTAGIDLVGDGTARRAVRRAGAQGGVTIALAYPFVLSRRTGAAALRPAVEAAADIGARGIGVLIYDRDPQRAGQELASLCAIASQLGVRPVLEFFGGSAVPTLGDADALGLGLSSTPIGLCVDLLHLVRSKGGPADLARVRTPILHAQLCDALRAAPADRDAEAALGRLALGEGDLDVAGFIDAVPETAWLGVEIPPPPMTREEEAARALALMAGAARATGG